MKTVLVCGLKGGVGKTHTTIQTAFALRRLGAEVGILDLDYRTPNVPVALDGGAARLDHSFDGDVLIPAESQGLKVMSMAYVWPDWKCVEVSDNDAMDDVRNLLTPGVINWGALDYLVVDTPPTSTGVVEVAFQAPGLIGALVVTHASVVSRMDTVRTLDMFREKQVPVFGMVCNQAGLHDLDASDMKAVAVNAGLNFFVSVPHTRRSEVLVPLFDRVAGAIVAAGPVLLEQKQLEDRQWKALVSLSKAFKSRTR